MTAACRLSLHDAYVSLAYIDVTSTANGLIFALINNLRAGLAIMASTAALHCSRRDVTSAHAPGQPP
jgi:hypothetical protein